MAVSTVTGALKTFSGEALHLHAQHKWGGHYVKSPPNTLRGTGAFVMTALFTTPSAGVVYTGKNKHGKECGWLVAWVNASGDGGRKVYAECGPKSKFDNVDWNKVKTNLESRGKTTFTCTDSATNTKVVVTIQGKGAQYAVAAAFSDY